MDGRLSTLTVLLLAAAAVALAARPVVADELSTFGTGDISHLLQDRTLVEKQIKCVLDNVGCDDLGRKLKAVLPEVLGNDCARCSAKQKANVRLLTGFIQRNYPRVWTAVEARYARKG